MSGYAKTAAPFDLSGKTALVAGGAGLLGREFARALAAAGAQVGIADVRQEEAETVAAAIQADLPDADLLPLGLDVTRRGSCDACVAALTARWEGLDVLINSAAVDAKFDPEADTTRFTRFTEFPLPLWEESVRVNLDGAFLLCQSVCCDMEKRGRGSIVLIGSNYGLNGPDQRIYRRVGAEAQSFKPPVYSVCKAGLLGLTKFLAAYYAGTEIRVNMLTPSGVYNQHDEEFTENYSAKTVLRRMSRPEEYRGAAVFLASDASSYMTGANLVMDGGWTAI